MSLIDASIAVGAAAIALDLALSMFCPPEPLWLPPFFTKRLVRQIGGRLARIEQLERAGLIDYRRLVVVLGTSTVREGLDPKVLAANDPEHRDWVTLGGSGSAFTQAEIYSRVFINSPVKPALVVLAIHEVNVVRMKRLDDRASLRVFVRAVLHGHPNQALLAGSWVYRNRSGLADWLMLQMQGAAALTRRILALPMSVAYEPEADPWTVWTQYSALRMPQAHMDELYEIFKRSLAPEQFANVDRQVRALRRMVAGARAKGSDLVLALFPNSSMIRTHHAPQLSALLEQAIAAAVPEPVRVIDLREAAPDRLFYDYWHLNAEGRGRLSAELPALIPSSPYQPFSAPTSGA